MRPLPKRGKAGSAAAAAFSHEGYARKRPSEAAPSAVFSKIFLLAQMLICAVGVNLCFGWWSVKQERVMKKPYFVSGGEMVDIIPDFTAGVTADVGTKMGGVASHRGTAVYMTSTYGVSLTQTLMGTVVSAILLGAQKTLQAVRSFQTRHPRDAANLGAPPHSEQAPKMALTRRDVRSLLAVGFSNLIGTSSGFASVRRLSYPVALTAKMSKMLPVILVGFFWHGTRYPARKVAACFLITGGAVAFFLIENYYKAAASEAGKAPRMSSNSSLLGICFILCNLLMDGFINSTQDVVVKRHQWSGLVLMMWTNAASVVCALAVLAALEFGEMPVRWVLSVTSSHSLAASMIPFRDLSQFIHFLARCPEACYDVLLMSLLNAVGQLFIFHTISVFGTLTLTAMTLLRKVASVILSIVVHGHSVHSAQWCTLVAIFMGVFWEGYINIQEASLRKRRSSGEPVGKRR